MRVCFALATALLLASCSETPAPTEAKKPAAPPEPITGRQAFQMTYPQARIWATDCQPMHIRSLNLPDLKSVDGKAGAWEILYVSASRARQRIYTWSAIEAEGNLHKGVFAGLEDGWHGATGQAQPFLVQALKIDTPDAYKTAVEHSAEYLRKTPNPPQVNFLLEYTPRFPDPAWRVFWGESVASAPWSVFIDATTGDYVGR